MKTKTHWTKTPEGKKKLAAAVHKGWKTRKKNGKAPIITTVATIRKMRARRRQSSKNVPLIVTQEPPFPSSVINAIEFGFRCAEQGMNLNATIDKAFNLLLERAGRA